MIKISDIMDGVCLKIYKMKKKYVNRIKIASFKVKPKKTLTLTIRLNSKYYRICSLKKCSVILLFFVFFSAFSQLSEVEKKAEQLFEEGEYTEAYKLYAQLVSNQPKNPLYNYRLGVCMIFSEPDKKKCFSYLLQAYKQKQELPKDVAFFLGKAYHLNYRFNEALKYYNEFKESAPSSLQKKYEVDREIRCCVNGKQLLSEITGLEVLQKKTLNESDYFRSYDIQTLDGKMLAKPDEFKTSADRKKKDKSVVFVPNKSSKIFFSSYGDNTSNGKDIYYRIRLPSGDFGKPVPVSAINTPYDEDYPYLCPDGKTLYFSSKGHNSMGGYDILKPYMMKIPIPGLHLKIWNFPSILRMTIICMFLWLTVKPPFSALPDTAPLEKQMY